MTRDTLHCLATLAKIHHRCSGSFMLTNAAIEQFQIFLLYIFVELNGRLHDQASFVPNGIVKS
jgi:hypothetical protein